MIDTPSNTPCTTYAVYALVETRSNHRYHGRVRYVGQSKQVDARIKSYRKGVGNNPHHTYWLRVCPDFDVLLLKTTDSKELADIAEIQIIARYDTFMSDHGLNYTPGGNGSGRVFTDAHRRALSLSKFGHTDHTSESRLKISEANKKVVHTPEWNAKVAAALKANQQVIDHIRSMSQNKTHDHLEKLKESASSKRWSCDECGMKSNAGGIGTHQKGSGHVGRHRTPSS